MQTRRLLMICILALLFVTGCNHKQVEEDTSDVTVSSEVSVITECGS